MASTASMRLQETLQWWKDLWFLTEMRARSSIGIQYGRNEGLVADSLTCWRQFERTVFDNTKTDLQTTEWALPEQLCKVYPLLGVLNWFPNEFFQWSRKSRRIFNLPKELQYAFALATFPDIRWEDVLLPYDAFIISLETPIRIEERVGEDRMIWVDYDTILVSRNKFGGEGSQYNDHHSIHIRLFRAPLKQGSGRYPDQEKREVESALRRHDYRRVGKTNERAWKKMTNNLLVPQGFRYKAIYHEPQQLQSSKVLLEPEHLLEASKQYADPAPGQGFEEHQWRMEHFSIAAKIAVGWCLYMQGLSSTKMEWQPSSYFRPAAPGVPTGIITDVDNICTVHAKGRIDAATYGFNVDPAKDGPAFFVRPHWRRAHKRRPPGSPLDALQTVKIPPRLIREDLVPMYGIIGGTETSVAPDDLDDE